MAGFARDVLIFFDHHPYLLAALLGLTPVVLAIALLPRLRGTIVLAGFVETLHSPFVVHFEDVYWRPHRLGGGSWGLEDVLVSFELGAGVWAAAAALAGRRLNIRIAPWQLIRRLVAVALLGAAAALAVSMLGARVMDTLIVVMAMAALTLAWLQPGLWRLSVLALAVYPAYYCLVLWLAISLAPGLEQVWSGPELRGPRIAGLPLEEIAFAAVFSTCYPLVMAWILDARWQAPGAGGRAGGDLRPGARRQGTWASSRSMPRAWLSRRQ